MRFDNGPEFIALAVADWCRFNSVGSIFIDPGSPWQNAESFNGRLRDELLNGWRFDNLLEAKVIIEDWRVESRYAGDLSVLWVCRSGWVTWPCRRVSFASRMMAVA